MNEDKPKNKGGRPKKQPTSTINFRLPVSRIEYLKATYPKLSELFKKWTDEL